TSRAPQWRKIMDEKMKVMVVDDELIIRESLFSYFRKYGHEIETASSGVEALDKLKKAPFHVLFVDIKMPGMDGMELLEKVKDEYPETMVVIITAYGSIESAAKAMRIGASDYLLKPFKPDQLSLTIERISHQRRLISEHNIQKVVMQQEKLASIGRLSAGVAHELNNPLTTILTSAMLIQEEFCPDQSVCMELQIVIGEALRCRKIVRSLLDFARQTEPAKELCDINDIVGECLVLTQKQAAFNDVKLVAELPGDLPLVYVDKGQIQQALINLILNAVEATDPGGKITISTTTFLQRFFSWYGVSAQARKDFRILIVDDEEIARTNLEHILKKEGFHVVTAVNGAEALDLLSRQPYHLMLTDIKMPGMDGVEVLRRARQDYPDLCVVMMTAYATVETAVEAMKIGALDYLLKPFDLDTLVSMVVRIYQDLELSRDLHKDGLMPLDDAVEIRITDTGKGIDPDELDKIFDPFFTTRESGTGLGLAITHGIVTQHGGGIDVKSKMGQGTTFIIRLPVDKGNNNDH
ncbi:response regulator, partial [Thermodesulfobacteriota bacterium]